jgi:hypothetical protein
MKWNERIAGQLVQDKTKREMKETNNPELQSAIQPYSGVRGHNHFTHYLSHFVTGFPGSCCLVQDLHSLSKLIGLPVVVLSV